MSQQPPSQRLRPFKPQRFGRYTLLMPIATGGMGEIFLAQLEGSHGFDKLCVIKKILSHLAEDRDFVDRFVDEARILVKLSHGNIAQVLELGVHEGAPFIALEFIDGKDLRRVLSRMRDRQTPLPLPFVLYTMIRVLDALAYAHRKRDDEDQELNLVHRDVSPQNILISYEGEVKVIDFGLAKSTLSSSRTNPSIIMGKFLYMSPEQARHQRVDRRSDLYAVGICLYELITARNPFDDVAPGDVMTRVASPELPPLTEVVPGCPQALSDVVQRALAVDPDERFQSAEELRAKLVTLLHDLDPAAGPESTARLMREAFAIEFLAERKMLSSVKEQSRQLADEPTDVSGMMENRMTAAELPAASEPTRVGVKPESLSFEPTRKSELGPPTELIPAVELDRELKATLRPSRDELPTEAELPIVQLPSVMVEGLEAGELPPDEPRPRPAPRPAQRRPRGDRKKTERTSERSSVKRETARPPPPTPPSPPTPDRSQTPIQTQLVQRPPKGPSLALWLVLPLFAALAVAAYIAWDVYIEDMRQQRLEEERRAAPHRRDGRIPGLDAQPAVVVPPVAEPQATPPKEERKEAPRVSATIRKSSSKGSAAEQAVLALRAEFERIVDEGEAKKFRLKVNKLELDLASRGDDPRFIEEVRRLHHEVSAAVAAQQ